MNNHYTHICELKDRHPQLCHASNIITKYNGKRTSGEKDILEMIIPEYAKYLDNMLGISGYDRQSVFKKVDILNEYYNFMHANGLDQVFSAQGKFRPTILEEFLFLLFKDYVKDVRICFEMFKNIC